ncbi:MAG TPA: hypothetical protein EYP43_04465 [Thermoplasmata archaeon]|nr:hypothetical protein [Thermoplasmata archaeon]
MDEVGAEEIVSTLRAIEEILLNTPPDRRFWGRQREEHIRREVARLRFLYVDLGLRGLARDLEIAQAMLGMLKGDSGVTFEIEG